MKSVIDKIYEYYEKYPQLCHASNILTKFEKNQSVDKLKLIANRYLEYIEGNLYFIGNNDSTIKKRVKLLNDYYNYIHYNGFDNLYSAQGKFRPTILEEFLFLLFKDFVEKYQTKHDAGEQLESGSVKAYSNLYFKAKSFGDFISNPEMAINEKDQDFAIYRKFQLTVNGTNTVDLQVPAIAIEAKTFIDKTMLDGIIATAEKVKSGNPYSMFVAVAETYDVAVGVDPAYSRIDQIYVLRKTTRKADWEDIDVNVVLRMVHEITAHLERPWSDVELRLKNEGVII